MPERRTAFGIPGKIRIAPEILAGVLTLLLCASSLGVTITSFSPAFGQPGNVIVIKGSGFTTTTNVSFNYSAPTLADFVINSDTQLTVVVPMGAMSGLLSIGTSSSGTTTSSSGFLVAPLITSFSPSTGTNPDVVYIQGQNFITGATSVYFTGVSSPISGDVRASNVVAATVPVGVTNGPITVTTTAGTAVSTSNFITSITPVITGFSPAAGGIGQSVTINGANFFSPVTVKFNGVTASASAPSTTEIQTSVPTGASTGPITVTTSSGSFTTSSNFLTGTGPIITDFYPSFGTINTPVTVDGINLNATSVTVNGVAQAINSTNPTLKFTIISNSGSGPIKVTTPAGSITTSSNFDATSAPIITNFSPIIGPAGTPGIIIGGINFIGASSVKFGSASASFSVPASTQITATVPASASTGVISVTTPSGTANSGSNFTVTSGSAPVITSFTPTNGVQGTVVTVNGANFTNLSAVQFNGVNATYTTPTSTTVLYPTVPAGASTGVISVRNSAGTGTSSALIYLQPWITNSTASNIVNLPLVVQGRNLTNATSLAVGGVNYASFTNSPTRVVATIPSNAVSGTIIITTPGGIFINTNSFTILPKIYTFSPNIGPAGTIVTINGTSLFNVSSVLFNGASATPFNVTTNQLQVAVPTGATPGYITVITPGGRDVSSNSFTATYSSAVDLSKTASPIITAPGTNVTFTLFVTNAGPSTVTSVSITDNVPTNFNVTTFSTTLGTVIQTNRNVVTSIPILASNASATITVKGTANIYGAFTNSANLGFAEGETVYGTNYAFAFAYFLNAADKTLSIARSTNAGQFILTWPNSGAPFAVQVNTNLTRGNGWQSAAGTPFVLNGVNEYTNSIPSNTTEFFRLKGP